MTARLATERETLDALREGARLEDCGSIERGEFNTHRNIVHLEMSMRDVSAQDVAIWAHDAELEDVSEYRRARVELAYAEAQWDGMERWLQ